MRQEDALQQHFVVRHISLTFGMFRAIQSCRSLGSDVTRQSNSVHSLVQMRATEQSCQSNRIRHILGTMSIDLPTYRHLTLAFLDFLTTATHTILHDRHLYPQTSFLSAKRFSFPVRQSRHPKVCQWINDAVAAVETELLKCSVARVAVVIYTKDNLAMERYVFAVEAFPIVAPSDIDTPMARAGNDEGSVGLLPGQDMEQQFRGAMGKLGQACAKMAPLPKGCTFTMAIELRDDEGGNAPIGHPQPWIPADGRAETEEAAVSTRPTTVPVRTVAAGAMIMETWIERRAAEY